MKLSVLSQWLSSWLQLKAFYKKVRALLDSVKFTVTITIQNFSQKKFIPHYKIDSTLSNFYKSVITQHLIRLFLFFSRCSYKAFSMIYGEKLF